MSVQNDAGAEMSKVSLADNILLLLFKERQLGGKAISQQLPNHDPADFKLALTDLKKNGLVEQHKFYPPHDLTFLTASGERRARTLLGQDVTELERSATIAMLELACQREVSHATTLPGVGPAIARDIFGKLSVRNGCLETRPARQEVASDALGYLTWHAVIGVPSSLLSHPAYSSGFQITPLGRQHLRALKAQQPAGNTGPA